MSAILADTDENKGQEIRNTGHYYATKAGFKKALNSTIWH